MASTELLNDFLFAKIIGQACDNSADQVCEKPSGRARCNASGKV
jgi:hypothetical protein